MSPAAVDWASSWPTRRSLVSSGGDEEKDTTLEDDEEEALASPMPVAVAFSPDAVVTQVLTQSPSAANPAASRARSSSPGRAIVPPSISAEAKGVAANYTFSTPAGMAGQAEFAVSEAVSYWSGTHMQWMEAVVQRQNFDSHGHLQTYDLDVKRGAQASKIRKQGAGDLQPPPEALQGNDGAARAPSMASMVQKVPTPVSNNASGLGDSPQPVGTSVPPVSAIEKTVGGLGALNQVVPTTLNQPVLPPSAIGPKVAMPTSGAATPAGLPAAMSVIGASASAAGAANVERQPPSSPEVNTNDGSVVALRRFEIGEKVEYWSSTYSQWMQAKVEKLRNCGVTYDLDVKRGAQRTKMRSAQRTAVTAPAAALPSAPGTASKAPESGAAPVAPASTVRPAVMPRGIAGVGPGVGTAQSAAPTVLPLRRDMLPVASSRLRAHSRDTVGEGDDISPTPMPKLAGAPDKISGAGSQGGYPRSGSPFLSDKHASPPEKGAAPSGYSQTAPVGDLRPRVAFPGGMGGAIATAKGRPEITRAGPSAAGSTDGTAPPPLRPAMAGALVPPALLTGASKAPRRLLPDSSGGPTIGTRPDSGTGPGASAAAGGLRPGIAQANSTVQVCVNGIVKKVSANGPVTGSSAPAEKVLVRPMPGTAPTAPSSNSTPSASSHRPPNPIAVPAAVGTPSMASAVPGKVVEESTAGVGNGVDLDGLGAATPTELTALALQLDFEPDADLRTGLRGQVVGALGRLSMRDLSRRLQEAQVDASGCKDRKELEKLLAQGMLARQRASAAAPGSATALGLSPQVPAGSERCRGVPPAGGGAVSSTACASSLVATGLSGAGVQHHPQLEVGEIEIGDGKFNPKEPALQAQLIAMLGYSKNSTIEEMTGFRGGLNEGVWFLSDSSQSPPVKDLVLKLVKCSRLGPRILTEAENFVKINADHCTIAKDPAVAFPVRIFKCLGSGPERTHRYDLIVMWKVHGERLAEYIAHKWYAKELHELWEIFERLGRVLASFHLRYNDSQHGDFQPSNVFYDEKTGDISLIDIGGMGVPTSETDQVHFTKSLKLLGDSYGAPLLDGQRSFEDGYAAGLRAR